MASPNAVDRRRSSVRCQLDDHRSERVLSPAGRKAVFRQSSDARNTDLLPVAPDVTFDCPIFCLLDFARFFLES
jgi:hypothetical protein